MHIYIKNETKIIIKKTTCPKSFIITDDGVQWWQQCARSFITPNGRAYEAPEPSKIFKRLQPFTCEWLTRPDVALSEYSDTITSNFPVLEEHGKKVLRKSFADKLKSHFEPIWEMQALNKKTPMPLQPPHMSRKFFAPCWTTMSLTPKWSEYSICREQCLRCQRIT
jgi:hypothetical protein